MGIAIRTGSPLSLNLAEPVWKQLAGMVLTPADITEVTVFIFSFLDLYEYHNLSMYHLQIMYGINVTQPFPLWLSMFRTHSPGFSAEQVQLLNNMLWRILCHLKMCSVNLHWMHKKSNRTVLSPICSVHIGRKSTIQSSCIGTGYSYIYILPGMECIMNLKYHCTLNLGKNTWVAAIENFSVASDHHIISHCVWSTASTAVH